MHRLDGIVLDTGALLVRNFLKIQNSEGLATWIRMENILVVRQSFRSERKFQEETPRSMILIKDYDGVLSSNQDTETIMKMIEDHD